MNHDDERAVRQQLHDELGSLEIPPAPVIAVTQRGRAIRARRRALAGGLAAVVAAALVAARFIGAPGPAPVQVTQNTPNPRAPAGVFASGTANGKPWRLAVRNIAADPGTRSCLPAVLFNSREGDMLVKTAPGMPSSSNPAYLGDIPGLPGIGALFAQVGAQDTRLVATWPHGGHVAALPVWVSACNQRFHLAGFAFADHGRGPSEISTYTKFGLDEGLDLGGLFTSPRVTGVTSPGVWVNLDESRVNMAGPQGGVSIGTGTVAGQIWHIRTVLGLDGQCYTGTMRGPVRSGTRGRGQSYECLPVSAPPRTIALAWVSVPSATTNLTGYAGLVNPRAKELVVRFDNGTTRFVHPVNVAGRFYVAFVVPPGCQVTRLSLRFAHYATTITALPLPGGGSTRRVAGTTGFP